MPRQEHWPCDRFCAAIALSSAIAACTGVGQYAGTSLDVLADGSFRYTAIASVLNPLNSDQGEHSRLVTLEHMLEAKALCPAGYEILSRTPPRAYGSIALRTTEDWVGPVTYIGRCRA
jgi:hypothetical protein